VPIGVASGVPSSPRPTVEAGRTNGGAVPAPKRTYRTLTALGLTPEEAANLTAFMCGIPIEGAHWSIRQINELLFLRELQRSGRFGRKDGGSRPH
jgi:hypothetical protein